MAKNLVFNNFFRQRSPRILLLWHLIIVLYDIFTPLLSSTFLSIAMAKGQPSKKPRVLNAKQQRFIEEYCIDFIGAKAAERAGYEPKRAKQTAYNLLQDERVAAILKHMALYSMSAVEAIKLMNDWGRGSFKPFLRVDPNGIQVLNLSSVEALENLHPLNKVKQTRHITRYEDTEIEDIRTEVELHDAKDAVHKMLQIHGKYAPKKFDHTTDGQPLPGTNIYVPDNGRDKVGGQAAQRRPARNLPATWLSGSG